MQLLHTVIFISGCITGGYGATRVLCWAVLPHPASPPTTATHTHAPAHTHTGTRTGTHTYAHTLYLEGHPPALLEQGLEVQAGDVLRLHHHPWGGPPLPLGHGVGAGGGHNAAQHGRGRRLGNSACVALVKHASLALAGVVEAVSALR